MKIADLIDGLPVSLAGGSGEASVEAIVEDSRLATSGCLFIARPGTETDGRRFIADAIARGAVAVLTDDATAVPDQVAALAAADVPVAAAHLAERFHGHPSRRLKLVGITGTNGKTTTAHLIHQLLNRYGIRTGLMGTVQIDDGQSVHPATLTTPPAIEISRTLSRMVEHGCTAGAMEVSSHALDQSRTAGLHFTGAVFTNISGDHLDYHHSMDSYIAAKRRLFESLPADGWAVINIDDSASAKMIDACKCRVVTTGLNDATADCRAEIRKLAIASTEVTFTGPWGMLDLNLPLVGHHNVINALQAAATCSLMGLEGETLAQGLLKCTSPPGRLEPVTDGDEDFSVLVDYAHTDAALENVLEALRPVLPEHGRLIVVFGCGGDRDRTKRPRMAAVACRLADEVIITSDNPRTEDPQAIVDEAAAGIPPQRRDQTAVQVDRAKAIELAVSMARPGDVILIAGKGHEDYQVVGHEKRHFDDREVAAAALRKHRLRPIPT
ncbi:MAG: UDP-N-acetylmuramoyl-L-alanyl-D-glutamate--2,6-diaminopimelate ligase [Phycisphaerales bacterium]|nr:MAG: UDP-N-acetylmuramoyl-L-alanyl-D-glutamate--2,6-diaminopimelate ligase [Phycisphaerales bacterium]